MSKDTEDRSKQTIRKSFENTREQSDNKLDYKKGTIPKRELESGREDTSKK